MRRKAVQITLLEEAVFSERPNTEGGHTGLTYIPGSALLGAAAARLYSRQPREHAWLLFHSGKVRFGNALPLVDGERAYPVPFALHHAKEKPWQTAERRLSEYVLNLAAGGDARSELGSEQPKQLRSGFVTPSGTVLQFLLAYRMKTAIDAGTGRAAQGQLFGYQALPAGSCFLGELSADDDVPDELWQQVLAVFEGELLLGRSRSAEYGRAVARLTDPIARESGSADDGVVVLWLLSDLAACDPWGQPTVEPRPEWLGLPQGEILWKRSFLRTRRYAPWNTYRNARDVERVVLQAGSVLTYHLHEPWTDVHDKRVAAGLGLYRECGLGSVWANPPLLRGVRPERAASTAAHTSTESFDEHAADLPPLIEWLQLTAARREARRSYAHNAERLAGRILDIYNLARHYMGRRDDQPVGPSQSQWGSMENKARNARNRDELYQQLFHEDTGICRVKMAGWGDEFYDDGKRHSFSSWLQEKLKNNCEPRFVQKLAHTVRSRLQAANRKEGTK